MKTENKLEKHFKNTAIFVIMFFLFAASAWACESCQLDFKNKLLSNTSTTLHAQEMLSLLGEGSARSAKSDIVPVSDVARSGTDSKIKGVSGVPRSATPELSAGQRPLVSNKSNEYSQKATKGKLPPTGFVPAGTKPDKKLTIKMSEGETFIGNGVVYKGFLIDGKVPGPTLIVDEGDVVEFTVVNDGAVPHGVSIHSAYTQTSKYLGKIPAGETKSHIFRATYPGVYMYHCAPGGHAIPMHVLLGQYGMMVVRPKTHQYKMEEVLNKKPDVELYLLQHELYQSGKDAIEGKPLYSMFNGKLFRYIEKPINVKPGDFVRIYFLNVGPNLISTFHIVGIIWDYAYWQGLPNPENTFVGGQSVLAGPTDSWVVDFRVPEDEGAYLMLNHAVGYTTRGSIGILNASNSAPRTTTTLADGPDYTKEELASYKQKAVRTIAPSEPGSEDLQNPWQMPYGQTKAKVQIIGNSFYPKVIEVPVGTTVEWTNEEVFTYFEGEFSGIHNVIGYSGPESFASPMLGHAEKFSYTFTKEGDYEYLCSPHPYMKGIVKVVKKQLANKSDKDNKVKVMKLVIRTQYFAVAGFVAATILPAVFPATKAFAAAGQDTYNRLCASCHGPDGAGDGPVGKALPAGLLPNLQAGTFKYGTDDEKLKEFISKGGAAVGLSPLMPAHTSLSPEELNDLVKFIHTLKKQKI